MKSVKNTKLTPYTPEEALKLIEQGRLRRTIVKDQNGQYQRARNVDEEAFETENIRIHTDEDQPAAIQVEDDEIVAYYDADTGYFYDADGVFLESVLDAGAQKTIEDKDEDGQVVQDENSPLQEDLKDLKSYVESVPSKKASGGKKPRAQTALPRARQNRLAAQQKLREEAWSQLSGAPADQTRSQTGVSVNKSYITQLENELNQERAAREKLQSDIE